MKPPVLDVGVREGVTEDVRTVACRLVPGWSSVEPSAVHLNEMDGGITNKLYRCKWNGTAVLVRVYGNHTDTIINRRKELDIVAELSRRKLGVPLYGRFRNGYVYGYIPGRSLVSEELRMRSFQRLTARETARWHTIHSLPRVPEEHGIFHSLERFLERLPSSLPKPEENAILQAIDREDMAAEIAELRVTMERRQMPPVFCHNDLLSGNIIYNKEKGTVGFVDFEYSSFNPRGYDIGNHFCEYCGFDGDFALYPKREEQWPFLHEYLKTSLQREPSEDEIEDLHSEVNLCSLASHLFWGLWSFIQSSISSIDFGFARYGKARIDAYFMYKDRFLV